MTNTPLDSLVPEVSDLSKVSDIAFEGSLVDPWTDLRLLDERGCLTDEVLCLVEELRAEQREVVDRHLARCSACSFQRNQLAQATQTMRRARPRVQFSLEARRLARQAVVRAVLEHQPRFSVPSDRRERRRRRWLHIGLVASLALAIVALTMLLLTLLGGCQKRSSSPSSRVHVRFTRGERVGRLAADLTAATAGPKGGFAGGTQGGEIWFLDATGAAFRITTAPVASRGATSRPRAEGHPTGAPSGSSASASAPSTLAGGASQPASQPALLRLRHHRGAVAALDFTASGDRLLSGGGRTVAVWTLDRSRKKGTLLNYLRGPQILTVGVFGSKGKEVFFGTDQGYVMRWQIDRHEAQAFASFRCRVHMVSPTRVGLSADRRCPHGTYDTNRRGQGYCAYPATHLLRRGPRLALACRDGYVNVLNLVSHRQRYRFAGALGGLTFVGSKTLFFARLDGRMQLYDSGQEDVDASLREVLRLHQPSYAAAAAGELVAIAGKRRITLLYGLQAHPAGVLRLKGTPIWVGLEVSGMKGRLTTILRDGEILRYSFISRRLGKKTPTPEA